MKDSPDASSRLDFKKWQYAIEYYAAVILLEALSLLPLAASRWIAGRFAGCVRLLDGRHRRRALTQMKERLGVGDREAGGIVARHFRYIGMAAAEFAYLYGRDSIDIASLVDFNGLDKVIPGMLAEGKGALLLSAHYGNWEWGNAALAHLGCKGAAIATPLKNARLNRLLNSVREKHGLSIIDKQFAIRKSLRLLARNEAVAALIDRYGGRKGMWLPFLGRQASTHTALIELALRVDAPILVSVLRRNRPGAAKQFSMVYNPELYRRRPGADLKEETRRVAESVNGFYSRIIREEPEQWWLWTHPRWRNSK